MHFSEGKHDVEQIAVRLGSSPLLYPDALFILFLPRGLALPTKITRANTGVDH